MGAAFAGALVLTLVVLATQGAGESGVTQALRVTARWSFLFFWMAYAGGALAALFGQTFRPLAARGRQFGLAFASAHLVHASLVAWLYHISVRPPVSTHTLIFFGVALVWTYVLALFSIRKLSEALPQTTWRIVRTVGVEYIGLVFLVDFGANPFNGSALHMLAYLPFLALCIAGPLMRIAAFFLRRHVRDRAHSRPVTDAVPTADTKSGSYSGPGTRR